MTNEEAVMQLQTALLLMTRGTGKTINNFHLALALAIQSLKAWDDLPSNVCSILIDEGQKNKKFQFGEIIKYAPSEIMDILKEYLGELQRGVKA